MTTHPLKTTYATGQAVSKGSILSYEMLEYKAASVNDVRSRDLSGTLYCTVPIGTTGRQFWNDPTDSVTPDDGLTCLRDFVGNCFKTRAISSADLTAAVINAALGAGGLNPNTIPGGGPAVLGIPNGGQFAAQPMSWLVTTLDAYFGSAAWRAAPYVANLAGTVADVAANKEWHTGGRGGKLNALLFQDGQVGVAGIGANGAEPTGSGTNNYRYQKIAFGDGVPRTIVKFWLGGRESIFAKTSDGLIWATGMNNCGQLGLGNTTAYNTWQEITYFRTNALTVSEVYTSPAGYSTWFLCSNGQLYFTGYNAAGVAGDGTVVQKTSPVRCGTLTNVTAVFPGEGNDLTGGTTVVGCLTGGTLYAWGYNANYQLGLNNVTQQNAPVSTGLTNVVKARFGMASFALKSDGTLWSCGYNGDGATGQGTTAGSTQVWTQIASLTTSVIDFEAGSARYVSVAAIVTGKNLRTWGYNWAGQLGVGNTANQSSPQTPTGAWQGTVDEIALGGAGNTNGNVSIYIRCGNAFYACGYNGNGNIGIGSTANVSAFARVLNINGNFKAWYIAPGYDDFTHGGFILTDTEAKAWGYNAQGQTGTHEGNLHYVAVPQHILVGGIVKGDSGANGIDGQNAGNLFAFDPSIAMAAPAAGMVRFNNAVLSSVTAIALAATSAETGNPDISDYVASWGASTSPGDKGALTLRKSGAPGTFDLFKITGAVVDNGTWLQIPVTFIGPVAATLPNNGDGLILQFARTGNTPPTTTIVGLAIALGG